MKKQRLAAIAAVVILAGSAAAARAAGDWKFEFTPYYWALGVDGDVTVNGKTADFSYSIGDIAERTDWAAEGLIVVQYRQYVAFLQGDYLRVSRDEFENAYAQQNLDKVTMDSSFAAVAAGYQFPTVKDSWVDAMVGGRFLFLDVEVDPKVGDNFSRSKTISDAIVVLRPNFHLVGKLRFNPTLSIGAGDSDLVYELQPQFQYNFSDTFGVRLGYRNLHYKFKKGDTLELNISFNGPMLGATFQF